MERVSEAIKILRDVESWIRHKKLIRVFAEGVAWGALVEKKAFGVREILEEAFEGPV